MWTGQKYRPVRVKMTSLILTARVMERCSKSGLAEKFLSHSGAENEARSKPKKQFIMQTFNGKISRQTVTFRSFDFNLLLDYSPD